MCRAFRLFGVSLGFLTRLGPGGMVAAEELAASVPCMPLVGLLLGLMLAAPWRVGLCGGHAWVQAWLYVGGSIWLTRGLHWDGWADVCDGWGSGARGDRFWEIVKDSRVGAFGVMGMCMGLVGQVVLAHEVLADGALGVLVFGGVLGRAFAVVLCRVGRGLTRPGLGRTFMEGATPGAVAFAMACCVACGAVLVPWPALLAMLGLAAGGVAALWRLGASRGGVNGDFLGMCILWGELAAPLGYVLAMPAA
ncbi:MAG: adenosylcobinamide-GDP ribazoletransferase [Desulfovibrionaceae bacterium]